MKVLHVVPSYIPAYRYGGSVKAVHELCRALVRKGLEISVFTTNIDWERDLDANVNEPQYVEGVRVFYYPVKHIRAYCFSRELALAVKKHVREFDIVHIHSIYLYPTFIAAYWCRKYNIPYIINPFGALDPYMIKLKGYFKKTVYITFIERSNVNGAKIIHAASDYEGEKIKSLGFKIPVAIVPRGLDLEAYAEDRKGNTLFEKYPQLKDKKIVIFLGRIHPKKGLDLLASAFKRVLEKRKDAYLLIAGPGENGYTDKIKRLFEKTGMTKQTLFTGMLLNNEKISALYKSGIFILPSYGENFGIAALEAMACRLPVIITNRVGLYPDVDEYKAGIVTDCDSEEIAGAILKLLDNENLRRSMGKRARKLVEDKFSLDKVSDRMIDVYTGLIKNETTNIGNSLNL